ncbi:VOC family protein [Granulicella sp. WH15]|uniref:VOC family protein n=1 Tax=Granulicella sp. WH15 TaxID=2602070 RepID=UPI0013A52C66|nr:VOC family protein [Granulicella sp. WH15]
MSSKAIFDAGIHPPQYRLPAATRVGRVRLAVSNLARSVAFYRDVVGLAVRTPEPDGIARLGAHGEETVLLELKAVPGVKPIGPRTRLGLYHTAFLLPSRAALASFVDHLRESVVSFGSADHLVSEAIYLTDPDGLQVEVYADRPRSEWRYDGHQLQMATDPLRSSELAALEHGRWQGAPVGTTMGHLHLYVGDLKMAAEFYHGGLGLDVMVWRYPGALFTSAGGYHHHVGLNVWAAGSPVASPEDARMLWWQLVVPEAEGAIASMRAAGFGDGPSFRDPWGTEVAVVEEIK